MIMRRDTSALGVNYHSKHIGFHQLRNNLNINSSCSVACATLHRATHPAVDDDAPPTTVEVGPAFNINGQTVKHTSGTSSAAGSRNPFTVLEEAKELQTLFMMYPRLRSQLREIYTATLPPTDDSTRMSGHYEDQGQSYRGKGRGRGRNGRGRDRASWNTDRGTQDGIDALCSAKEQYGKGGEGVREYAELVLKLVSMEGVDVARLVQEEVAEENAKIIAQLLNGDSF
jgi:zinc finger HIT domain-containing protein 3